MSRRFRPEPQPTTGKTEKGFKVTNKSPRGIVHHAGVVVKDSACLLDF